MRLALGPLCHGLVVGRACVRQDDAYFAQQADSTVLFSRFATNVRHHRLFPIPATRAPSEYVSASLGPYCVLAVLVKFTTVSGPQGRCNQSRYILSCGKLGCTLFTPTSAAVTENEDELESEIFP